MRLKIAIFFIALASAFSTGVFAHDFNVLSPHELSIYQAKLTEAIRKLRVRTSHILDESKESIDPQFTIGYKNPDDGKYVLPLPIEDERCFSLIGSDFELAQYYAGLGDALYFSGNLCDMAVFYWGKSISYSNKISDKSSLDILAMLEWNSVNLLKKIDACKSQIGPTYEPSFEFNEAAFTSINKQGVKLTYALPSFFHEAHTPILVGKKVFILGYNGKDYCLFIFNSETSAFLKWICVARELDMIDPFTIRYERGFLYIENNVVSSTFNPLTLNLVTSKISIQNIKNRNNPSDPFFSTSLMLNPSLLGYAMGEIRYLDVSEILKPLVGILQKNSYVSVLTSALLILQQKDMNHKEVHHVLIKMLSDESRQEILESAIFILGRWGVQEVVEPLMTMTRHRNEIVARSACMALGMLNNPIAIDTLLEALHDPRPVVQTGAISAFCSILHEDAIPQLMKLFYESKNTDVKKGIVIALARFYKYYGAIDLYIEALNDDLLTDVRNAAANGLIQINNERVTEALLDRLQIETSEEIQKTLVKTLTYKMKGASAATKKKIEEGFALYSQKPTKKTGK